MWKDALLRRRQIDLPALVVEAFGHFFHAGFGIGLVLVAQIIYSITAENLEEFATLKAMGASNLDVRLVVLVQSLVCGVLGGIAGLALVGPFATAIRPIVTWITVPYWIYFVVALVLIVLCVGAALIAAR